MNRHLNQLILNNTLFIDKTTNSVGINTINPLYNLDVDGTINSSGNLTTSGNVGIGMTNPQIPLSVSGTGSYGLMYMKGTSSETAIMMNDPAGITPTPAPGYTGWYVGQTTTFGASNNSFGIARFSAGGAVAGTGLWITASGNVGIGNPAPTYKLDVNGTTNLGGEVTLPVNTWIYSSDTTFHKQRMWFDNDGTTYIGAPYGGFTFINTASLSVPHPVIFSIAQNGTLGNIANDVWHTSADGKKRLRFVANSTTYYGSPNGNHAFRNSADTDKFTIDDFGNIIAQGDITATGNVTAYSDARVKTNISTIDSPLEKVMKMRGVYYNRIDDSNIKPIRCVGVIAQEVEEVLPEVVLTDTSENKNKSVAYGNIVALLIEGMKAQQSTIESLLLR